MTAESGASPHATTIPQPPFRRNRRRAVAARNYGRVNETESRKPTGYPKARTTGRARPARPRLTRRHATATRGEMLAAAQHAGAAIGGAQ
ncbi:hypothetical protein C7S17_5018 [Burkholderia thailandensis]|nr:hypothetical protein [Burkholderia thailandensis]